MTFLKWLLELFRNALPAGPPKFVEEADWLSPEQVLAQDAYRAYLDISDEAGASPCSWGEYLFRYRNRIVDDVEKEN